MLNGSGLLSGDLSRSYRAESSACHSRTPGMCIAHGLFRASRCIPNTVGVGTCSGKLSFLDNKILRLNGPFGKPAFQNFTDTRSVTCLRRKRRASHMRRHAVMGHCPPRMILRGWLRKPDIARIARKLPAFECTDNCILVADFGACRIHYIGAALHLGDEHIVEHMLGLR